MPLSYQKQRLNEQIYTPVLLVGQDYKTKRGFKPLPHAVQSRLLHCWDSWILAIVPVLRSRHSIMRVHISHLAHTLHLIHHGVHKEEYMAVECT